jgi:hypothetical protein
MHTSTLRHTRLRVIVTFFHLSTAQVHHSRCVGSPSCPAVHKAGSTSSSLWDMKRRGWRWSKARDTAEEKGDDDA